MAFKKAREEAGKTIAETSKACGVSRQAVHGWERGEYKPSADMLVKLAAFYGCSIDELLTSEDNDVTYIYRSKNFPTHRGGVTK